MVKQKRRLQKGAALALAFLFLAGSLASCKVKKNLPYYQFDDAQNPVLTVDGVRYIGDTAVISIYDHTGLYWKFIGEIGDTIGVCGGRDAERGGGDDVCEIKGDEERCFLYVQPNRFVIGPYVTHILAREDVQITLPTTETVSSVAVIDKNEESVSAQMDDPAMISALLEVFSGDIVQTPNLDGCGHVSLILNHKDFPFLQCEIKCYYSLDQRKVYCQNKDREWLVLPAGWYEVISEHDFLTKDE